MCVYVYKSREERNYLLSSITLFSIFHLSNIYLKPVDKMKVYFS